MKNTAWNALAVEILRVGVLPVSMKVEMPTRAKPQVVTAYVDGIFPVRDMSRCLNSRKAIYYKQGNEV